MKLFSLKIFFLIFYTADLLGQSNAYEVFLENKKPNLYKPRSLDTRENTMRPVSTPYQDFSIVIPAQYLQKKENGFVDIESSLKKWANSGEVPDKKSYNGLQKFFPVKLWNFRELQNKNTLVEMDLLNLAKTKNLKVLKLEKTNLIENKKTEGDLVECKDCGPSKSGGLSMIEELKNYLDPPAVSTPLELTIRPPIPTSVSKTIDEDCLKNIKPLDQLYPIKSEFWWSKKSTCVQWIKRNACNNSVWKSKSVKEKYENLIDTAKPISNDFNISPNLLACIGAKETSTLEPSIRTEAACGQKIKDGKKLPNAYSSTASGLFQITQTLMGDILRRRVRISLTKHPEAMRVFRKHISEGDIGYINSLNLSEDKECHEYPRCKKIMRRLWYAMPQDLELQVTLSLIGLETTGSVAAYHGGSDEKLIEDYSSRVEDCQSCMLKMKGKEEHRCLVLAASNNGVVNGYNDRKLSSENTSNFEDLEKNNKGKQNTYCDKGSSKC